MNDAYNQAILAAGTAPRPARRRNWTLRLALAVVALLGLAVAAAPPSHRTTRTGLYRQPPSAAKLEHLSARPPRRASHAAGPRRARVARRRGPDLAVVLALGVAIDVVVLCRGRSTRST
jgi:hypothetical protein